MALVLYSDNGWYFYFDGTDDYLIIPTVSSLIYNGCWIKLNS